MLEEVHEYDCISIDSAHFSQHSFSPFIHIQLPMHILVHYQGVPVYTYSKSFEDMEEVASTLQNRFVGRKVLMLVKRSSILDDTLHYMTKENFTPTSGITVSASYYKVVYVTGQAKRMLSSRSLTLRKT